MPKLNTAIAYSSASDPYKAAREAAQTAIKNIEEIDFALVFCSSQDDNSIKAVAQGIDEILGPNCRWAGCAMPGLNKQVLISATSSRHMRVEAGIGGGLSKNTARAVSSAVTDVLSKLDLDKNIEQYLSYIAMQENKKHTLTTLQPYNVVALFPQASLNNVVVKELTKALSSLIPISGYTGRIFNKDTIFDDSILLFLQTFDQDVGADQLHYKLLNFVPSQNFIGHKY